MWNSITEYPVLPVQTAVIVQVKWELVYAMSKTGGVAVIFLNSLSWKSTGCPKTLKV